MVLATGCYAYQVRPQPTPVVATAPAAGAGVYINGTLLTAQDRQLLDAIVGGAVPAGRYFVDANGWMGVEGGPAEIDLAQRVRQKQAENPKAFSMYSQDTSGDGSSIVSDGKGCTILSTPSGSLASGNC